MSLNKYFIEKYNYNYFIGASSNFITAIQKAQSGIPYGIVVPNPLKAIAFDCGADESYYGSGRNPQYNVVKRRMNDGYLDAVIPFFQTQPLETLVIRNGDLTGCGGIENLFYRLHFQPCSKTLVNIDLSNNNMVDYGANYILESIKSNRYPSLKNINISGNGITPLGIDLIKEALKHIKQDIVIIYSDINNIKQGFYKGNSQPTRCVTIAPNQSGSTDVAISSAISGISAGDSHEGDTCPASVKDQVIACITGAAGGATAGYITCAPSGAGYPVCIATAAAAGCAGNTVRVNMTPCLLTAYDRISGNSKDSNCSSKDRDCGNNDKCTKGDKNCSDNNSSGVCRSTSYW